jgi:hypothetical protein
VGLAAALLAVLLVALFGWALVQAVLPGLARVVAAVELAAPGIFEAFGLLLSRIFGMKSRLRAKTPPRSE